jgi:hypothetical protein
MEVLGTLGIIVGLLCSFGIFLDKHHFEQSTIEKVRNHLIASFIFLDDLPDRLRDRSSPFIRWFDKLHEKGDFDVRTGAYSGRTRNWTTWVRVGQVALGIGIFAVEQYSRTSLLVSVMEAFVVVYIAPLILLIGAGAWVALVTAVLLLLTLAITIVRRFALLLLNKATSPRNTPFTYLAAVVSIFISFGEGIHQLALRWDLELPSITMFDRDPLTVGPGVPGVGGGDSSCDFGSKPRPGGPCGPP